MASRKIYYTQTEPNSGVSGTAYSYYYGASTIMQGSLFMPEIGDIIVMQLPQNNQSITYYGITDISYTSSKEVSGHTFTNLEIPTLWCSQFATSGGGGARISVVNDHTLKVF